MRDFRRPSPGSDTPVAPLPRALTAPFRAAGENHTPTTTYAVTGPIAARPYAFPMAPRDEPATVPGPRPALPETIG